MLTKVVFVWKNGRETLKAAADWQSRVRSKDVKFSGRVVNYQALADGSETVPVLSPSEPSLPKNVQSPVVPRGQKKTGATSAKAKAKPKPKAKGQKGGGKGAKSGKKGERTGGR